MIFDMQTLNAQYKHLSNLGQRIHNDCLKKNLIRIKRGLYTNDLQTDSPLIANMCYGPSYLSFEYALSYYGLIPEHVSAYTSACFNKKNNKIYSSSTFYFEYRSVPNEVFPFGINYLQNEKGMTYKIASREKALCDMLYIKYPVRSIKDLKIMMFEDLRLDEDEFLKLDFDFIFQIVPLYHSNTLLTLIRLMKGLKNDKHN